MQNKNKNFLFYLGLSTVSATVLIIEISLTRLLSVITWYHLAFFAISTGLLGLTTGAVTVYLKPDWFSSKLLPKSASISSLLLSLTIPISLILILLIPIHHSISLMGIFSILFVTAICITPFYFAGITISAVITKSDLPIGRIYASDLLGAGIGSLIALLGLEVMSTVNLILICSIFGSLATLCFALYGSHLKIIKIGIGVFVVLMIFSIFNISSKYRIRPIVVKEKIETNDDIQIERWNSYSRILVTKREVGAPQISSPSPITPTNLSNVQFPINIDGNAGTNIREFKQLSDIEHLEFDGTTTAYRLDKDGKVCIIGFGGGKDILGAILFGYDDILAVDVNEIFVDLLTNDFRDFAGIANRDGVTLEADEARSYFSRHDLSCSIIQMSLVDTWAATGAGAFSLTENGLYTVEAWKIFFDRLSDNGIFTVSRWYSPDTLGETGRLVNLAMATLMELGVDEPENHISLITSGNIATILVNKEPFSQEEINLLKGLVEKYKFGAAIFPGESPENEILNLIMRSETLEQVRNVTDNSPYNFNPPTDETPYFFNLLKLDNIGMIFHPSKGVISGNSVATITLVILLISLLLLAVVFIILPIAIKRRSEGEKSPATLWSGALYFSLIGAGFMFVEIALIQRLSVFLGHPIYALGVLLFTIITSAGIGSLISEFLPISRSPWVYILSVFTFVLFLLLQPIATAIISNFEQAEILLKILVSIGLIAPIGLLLGFFFPTGMRLFKPTADSETPWYWALNSIFGVLASAMAVLIAIFFSISMNIFIAAFCYGLLLIPIFDIKRRMKMITD